MKKSLILAFATLVFCGCSSPKSALSEGGSSNSLGTTEKLPPVALMSSEQMLKTMISTTGIEGLGELTTASDTLIKTTYDLRTGSLPSNQLISSATGPTLISATNLASTVCAKAVDRDRATGEAQRNDRLFFREFDFSKGLAAQDSQAVTQAFARLARNAWRRDVASEETSKIVTFAQEFSSGVNANDPVQVRLLAVGICTATLSSLDALTY